MLDKKNWLDLHPFSSEDDYETAKLYARIRRIRAQRELAALTAPRAAPLPPQRTGLPGRPPDSRELYMAEFERRIAARTVEGKIADEAQVLLDWLKKNYPLAARPTHKTVTNNIGPILRAARSQSKTRPK